MKMKNKWKRMFAFSMSMLLAGSMPEAASAMFMDGLAGDHMVSMVTGEKAGTGDGTDALSAFSLPGFERIATDSNAAKEPESKLVATNSDAVRKEEYPDTEAGEVTVLFSKVDMTTVQEGETELEVFHADETLDSVQKMYSTVDEDAKTVEVKAESFSVYAISYLKNGTRAGHMASRPQDGSTVEYPFLKGTASSDSFRIPALATNGQKVYLLCVLYPYGVASNGKGNTLPKEVTGFNEDGKLRLKQPSADDSESSYQFYLDGDTIYTKDGKAVQGYVVDEYFNITGNGVDSNLFFHDSPYQVMRTSYLYLTSSDGEEGWSAPKLLNLKTDKEMAYLVSPGRGIVTGDGIIVFPTYSYKGNEETQRMDFIYSNDDGETWKRAETTGTPNQWSSESAVVELYDGTLRFFFRNGTKHLCYVDFADDEWERPIQTNVVINSNCQISAIKYSQKQRGNEVILVSCPTGPDGTGSNESTGGSAENGGKRLNGRIFVGVVKEDYSVEESNIMEWGEDKSIQVNTDNKEYGDTRWIFGR